MNICVIIPVHNEANTIGSLVESLKQKNLDTVVIDDGSCDLSGMIARQKGADVIFHEGKKGKGSSLKEGFQYALEKNYEAVIAMDGDGQHDPGDIEQFLNLAQQFPVSVINGSRMRDHQKMPWVRYLTNKFMSLLISLSCRQSIPDTQCGFRYISCGILKEIQLTSNEFEIETEILMKAAKKGFRIYSVPIKTIYRNEKSKIAPFKDTLRFFGYFFRELLSGGR